MATSKANKETWFLPSGQGEGESLPDPGVEKGGVPFDVRPLEIAVPVLLGLIVWTVVCFEPLRFELGLSTTRAPRVMLYLQPLIMLGVGLASRRTPFLMVIFPVSLLAGFFLMEPLDLRPLGTLRGGLTLFGALLLFLIGTARYGARSNRGEEARGERMEVGSDPQARWFSVYLWPRLVLLVALLLAPLWGLYGEGASETLARNFADRADDALILIHTVHLFIVLLVGYVFFLSPAINVEIEVADLQRKLTQWNSAKAVTTHGRRVTALLVGVALLIVFLSCWSR